MRYYSTNGKAPLATLEKAVVKGLAEDKGLYMPERIKPLPQVFFDNIQDMSLQEIAYQVADCFFGEDVDAESLRKIVPSSRSKRTSMHWSCFTALPSPSRMLERASWHDCYHISPHYGGVRRGLLMSLLPRVATPVLP